jgi:F0F1-type ATP synthase assembly protein I
MSAEEDERDFDPVMAIPLGSTAGMLIGLLVGLTLVDNLGYAIAMGMGVGTMIGTVAYGLLSQSEES